MIVYPEFTWFHDLVRGQNVEAHSVEMERLPTVFMLFTTMPTQSPCLIRGMIVSPRKLLSSDRSGTEGMEGRDHEVLFMNPIGMLCSEILGILV